MKTLREERQRARPRGRLRGSRHAELPGRSQQLADATPISRVRTGVRTIVELTAYPDDHANIAGGRSDPSQRRAMRYKCADSLPLNHHRSLRFCLTAMLDRLFEEAATED